MPKYGLIPLCFPKHKRWAVEVDYADQLSESDASWLDKFNREFHEGAVRKKDDQALHFEDELRRDCYRRNNAQNRDLYGIKAACGLLNFEDFTASEGHPEQGYIDELDEHLVFGLSIYLLARTLLRVHAVRLFLPYQLPLF